MRRLFLAACLLLGLRANAKCVQIYYDEAPSAQPAFTYGRVVAMFLQNLVAHFPEIQQYVIPIEKYEKGQIERCEANFYLGTYYDNEYPEAFHDDFVSTKRTAVWLGYNLWKLGDERLKQLWNVKYRAIAQPDWQSLGEKKHPAFFKYYDYKGETFEKFGGLAADGSLNAAFDIILLDRLDGNNGAEVVATARHSKTNETVPYILRNKNHWFVADTPFAYLHEEDRYLIFADVLFDMLDEAPRYPKKKPAMVRFEDVHPQLPLWQVQALVNAAKKVSVPFTISLIPEFADPYLAVAESPSEMAVKIGDRPQFVSLIKDAQKSGGTVVMHGVTHQSDSMKNPTGASGADYEFWDSIQNKPMPNDSAAFVVNRLEQGISMLEDVGIKPAAWLTPHYEASALDNELFAQLFGWNVGRLWYVPYTMSQATKLPASLSFDLSGKSKNGQRLPYFADLKMQYDATLVPSGQFFPYEIYGDVYGQRVVPEDAGYLRPPSAAREDVQEGFLVDDVLRILKRNRVLRDTWASFFVHPYLVNAKAQGGLGAFNGDTAEIERLFNGAKALGYEFVNLSEWEKAHAGIMRPEPITIH